MKNFDKVTSFTKLHFYRLFQNQVEWFLLAFFSWRHLYANWWFSWHKLSEELTRKLWLTWIFRFILEIVLLTSTLRLIFLHLHFTITDSFFFKRWQACKSSALTSFSVKESTLQIFTSSSSSLIDGGTGFTSMDPCRWYWALVTAFSSNWTTPSVNNLLQFLAIAKWDETTSNLLKKSSNRFDKSDSFDVISSIVMSSSINSSFERFSCLNHFSNRWW